MPAFTVSPEVAREAFVSSVEAFTAAAAGAGEWQLMGASRCHGWSRLDVVTHVLDGWQELGLAFTARTDAPATVDAATYWTSFATDQSETDPVRLLLAQRRRSDSYTRPEVALTQLRDVAAAVVRGASSLQAGHHDFQGYVLTAGDLLATWAVENVIHHLDLDIDLPPPQNALDIARGTCDALLGSPMPSSWDATEAVLVATGRSTRSDLPDQIAARVPVI